MTDSNRWYVHHNAELDLFEIRDRHHSLVPGVPLVAHVLSGFTREQADKFCKDINDEYNPTVEIRRKPDPPSS